MALLDKNATRRQALGLGVASSAAIFGLAACGNSAPAPAASTGSAAAGSAAAEAEPVAVDAKAYDALIAAGPVAAEADVTASTWASAVKTAGKLKVGGVETSQLFALRNTEDNTVRGFDAGLYQLLTRYILGDEKANELTQVTSDTRESLLENKTVDAVFATYSITDERKQKISFAGPYYTSQQGILVAASNTDINKVADLAGKNVAVQSGSTGPKILEEAAPDAVQQEFKTDEEARRALEQGRVDAYVIDMTMQLSAMLANPGKYRLCNDPFGPIDPYGIGLPKDSDGVAFVNAFLTKIEGDGTWAKLWQICIGDRTGVDTAPEPPAVEA